ncbi:MAG: uracil phosphoribosyltransferase [Bacteroidetes bacterium]|nr:uracil phosphoribosyltransferase [Bacteroidota bacterium]
MIHNLSEQHSIFSTFLGEMRDVNFQKDSMRFRKNSNRIGFVLGYEISKALAYNLHSIKTPLGISKTPLLNDQPVLATILRAGLALHEGLLEVFDKAESAFVSAYRKHSSAEHFDIEVEYLAGPDLTDKTLIISDPMLATGLSMYTVYEALLRNGQPNRVIIAATIASPEALIFLQNKMPKDTLYYVGAIDEELTAQSYIVPGMGDAGDLAYGQKLNS